MSKIRLTRARGCCGVVVAAPLLILLINCGILPLINPARQSERAITKSLLKQTPLGSTRDEVNAFIQRQGWHMGVIYRGKNIGERTAEERKESERWQSANAGYYDDFLVFDTVVYAEWHFDDAGQLDSIRVWKRWLSCP
jgi:hypothetical protein